MPRSRQSPLFGATAFPLERAVVAGCIDPKKRPKDAVFETAFEGSLQALDPTARRGALAGITGHIAESVAELVLEGCGWTPVWHFRGPGGHGVDLLLLGPAAERMFAVEVKGTLRPRYWPRLRRGALSQMEIGWLDKSDNPALRNWEVTSDDVYGAIVVVNFHDLLFRVGLTSDFMTWHPIERLGQVEDVGWLDAALRGD